MDVAAKGAFFQGGTDAFIEDWLETGVKPRTVNFRRGWKRKGDGGWHAFESGRYSVNSWDLDKGKRSFNFRTNWNAGTSRDETGAFYFMTAGGRKTVSTTANPSRHEIQRRDGKPGYAPIKLRSAKLSVQAGGKLTVSWENDPATLPQFSFALSLSDNPAIGGGSLAKVEKIQPHTRQAELSIPDGLDLKRVMVRLQCRDILDNQSAVLLLRLPE